MNTYINAVQDFMPVNQNSTSNFVSGQGYYSCGTMPSFLQNRWTIEIWCYLDALVDEMTLVSKQGEFTLTTQNTNIAAAFAGNGPTITATNVLQEHTWYLVSISFDGSAMTIYLNGVRLIQASGLTPPAATDNNWVIGGDFYGQIDTCRLWSTVLTPYQISNNQWTNYPAATSYLEAQFDMSVMPAQDTSGNNVSITPAGNGIEFNTLVPAVSFNGTAFCDPYDDQNIIPSGTTDFSVMATINPQYLPEPPYNTNAADDNMIIISNGTDVSPDGFILSVNAAGNVVFQLGNATPLISNTMLNADTWYHLAAIWTADTQTADIYINGIFDSSVANLPAPGMQGAVLIGAIDSVAADMAISGFQGYIQYVSLWNEAISESQILADIQNGPQFSAMTNCLAYYDLSALPAQNLITLNPVGLVSGASYAMQQSIGTISNSGALSAVHPVTEPSTEGKIMDASLVQAVMEDFELFAIKRGIQGDRLDAMKSLAISNLQSSSSTNAMRFSIETGDNAMKRLRLHHADGQSEIVYEAQISDCTMALIMLITQLIGGLVTAFGLVYESSSFAKGMTSYLGSRINTIGLGPQLTAIFSGGTVSITKIFNALKLLREYSLLVPLAKFSWQLLSNSLSWWTVISLGARIVLIFSPAGPAEAVWFAAQLAKSLYDITSAVNQYLTDCSNITADCGCVSPSQPALHAAQL
ncbi:LamG domain-containing protein [Chitinophaga sp. Cy-1792]|uniref:LamG domain-containing protein n=1 Tax=Chitinophaga sp. Cy-1792 TaxID=2608339 RepID=UPI00141DC9B7|nr:LamG domain-containing protein [Chitinophaga sp. Cy-1792]NIG56180.1 LamG domain-containing protein [Chitinophaga sp. Cy-1792]